MSRIQYALTKTTRLGIRTSTTKDTEGLELSRRLAHSHGLAGVPCGYLLHGCQYVQRKRLNISFRD
jgi:hypothetical protein